MNRVAAMLERLTLEEKVAMVAGSGPWHSTGIERLGIPAFKMTDGPNAARGDARSGERACCFPVGVSLGASWNVELLKVNQSLQAAPDQRSGGLALGKLRTIRV